MNVRVCFVAVLVAICSACGAAGESAADPAARLGVEPLVSDPGPERRVSLMDVLVRSYPEALQSYSDGILIWQDGTRMNVSDGIPTKTPSEILDAPDIDDMFAWNYPVASDDAPSPPTTDPGRIRAQSFFTKMYGDCSAGEVERNLVSVDWVGGRTVRITRVNGVAEALAQVARELEALGPEFSRYLWPLGGTYGCRAIAGTSRYSMHSYGAAIDLNTAYSAYWQWADRAAGGIAPYENRIPAEIVQVFARHGFVWGGNWAHFDTMHFEYRPELIAASAITRDQPEQLERPSTQ